MITFQKLPLILPIYKAIDELGYKKPTPIQEQAIPLVLKRRDLLGCAQTGTGKTAAFAIPILQLLAEKKQERKPVIRTLILTPTRELAIQIDECFTQYGKYLNLKHTVIFGGVGQTPQVIQIKNGVDILVATPGRLLDLMSQKIISLKDIEIFVLDEADRMLDMGFVHDVKKVLQVLPQKRQSLFFSATMPKTIKALADTILKDPVRVEITPESTTAETVQQSLYYVDKENKIDLLCDLIKGDIRESVLVFTRTKHGADKVVKLLDKRGIKAAAIHGNKSQNNRQNALENFKTKKIQVLVATDIAARGIDIDRLKYVINYEIPNIPETYVHRIGRGGRAGAEGIALSFCDVDEMAYIKDIQKVIGMPIPVVKDHPYPMTNFTPEPPAQKKPFQRRPQENKKPSRSNNKPADNPAKKKFPPRFKK